MAQLRIGLAQVDPTVGDLAGNADLVSALDGTRRGAGLPPRRLPRDGPHRLPRRGPRPALARSSRRASTALEALAAPAGRRGRRRRRRRRRLLRPHRAAGAGAGPPRRRAAELRRASCTAGASSPRYAKHHLPNYGVFDEFRYFVRGDRLPVVRLHGVDVATVVCEDLWQDGGPIAVARAARGRAGRLHQRLAVRARQGRRARAARRPPRGRGRCRRSPTSTPSAARTSWSSTATRSSSTRTARCVARAPTVGGAAARRRPRPAARRPARSTGPVDAARRHDDDRRSGSS